jgi:hypothetical protein
VAERHGENGCELAFRLNTDELVIAGSDHPIIARGSADTPSLYVLVRRGCEAKLNRSTYQQLAEIALAGTEQLDSDQWSVASRGEKFSLVPE